MPYEVADVAKAARLFAVAEDGERLAAQGLGDEVGDDPAVGQAHAWPVGVEDANDAGVDVVIATIGHRHRLGKALGFVVDAARADGVDIAPVVLLLRMDERVAIDFRRGSEQEASVLGFGEAERFVRAEGADLERLDRQLQVVDRAGWGGKVQEGVDGAFNVNEGSNVVLDEEEPLTAGQVLNVGSVAGDEVVHGDNIMTLGQETVAQVRPKKTGAAGDEYPHGNLPRCESEAGAQLRRSVLSVDCYMVAQNDRRRLDVARRRVVQRKGLACSTIAQTRIAVLVPAARPST